jgi:hypothetical protein
MNPLSGAPIDLTYYLEANSKYYFTVFCESLIFERIILQLALAQ